MLSMLIGIPVSRRGTYLAYPEPYRACIFGAALPDLFWPRYES